MDPTNTAKLLSYFDNDKPLWSTDREGDLRGLWKVYRRSVISARPGEDRNAAAGLPPSGSAPGSEAAASASASALAAAAAAAAAKEVTAARREAAQLRESLEVARRRGAEAEATLASERADHADARDSDATRGASEDARAASMLSEKVEMMESLHAKERDNWERATADAEARTQQMADDIRALRGSTVAELRCHVVRLFEAVVMPGTDGAVPEAAEARLPVGDDWDPSREVARLARHLARCRARWQQQTADGEKEDAAGSSLPSADAAHVAELEGDLAAEREKSDNLSARLEASAMDLANANSANNTLQRAMETTEQAHDEHVAQLQASAKDLADRNAEHVRARDEQAERYKAFLVKSSEAQKALQRAKIDVAAAAEERNTAEAALKAVSVERDSMRRYIEDVQENAENSQQKPPMVPEGDAMTTREARPSVEAQDGALDGSEPPHKTGTSVAAVVGAGRGRESKQGQRHTIDTDVEASRDPVALTDLSIGSPTSVGNSLTASEQSPAFGRSTAETENVERRPSNPCTVGTMDAEEAVELVDAVDAVASAVDITTSVATTDGRAASLDASDDAKSANEAATLEEVDEVGAAAASLTAGRYGTKGMDAMDERRGETEGMVDDNSFEVTFPAGDPGIELANCRREHGGIEVYSIASDERALMLQAVRVGDLIVAINGRDTYGCDRYTAMDMLLDAAVEPFTVTFVHGGAQAGEDTMGRVRQCNTGEL